MAAVAQDLTIELVAEKTLHAPELLVVTGDTEIGEHQRGERQQPVVARRRVMPGRGEMLDLQPEAVGRYLVGSWRRAFEDEAGVGDPGHNAARDDGVLIGTRKCRSAAGEPIGDELAGHAMGCIAVCRAQITQPAKAVEFARPRRRRRHQRKRRVPVEVDNGAAETELPGSQLLEQARIGGAQILRDDKQLVGDGGTGKPSEHRGPHRPAHRAPSSARGGEAQQVQTL